jgi:hypothetical protein
MRRLLSLILACPAACFPGIQAVPHLRELASQAGEVIVGTIRSASVSQIGDRNRPMSSLSVEIQVVRSVAGVLQPTQRVSLQWTQAGATVSAGSLKGDTGIWFLKRAASEAWIPVPFVAQPRDLNDVRVPTTAAEPGSAYQYSKDAPLADKALLEVLNAAEQDTSSRFSYVYWGAYDDFRPSIVEPFYRRLAASALPAASAQGLAGLIRLGRTDALLLVERSLPTLTPFLGQIAFSIAAYFRTTVSGQSCEGLRRSSRRRARPVRSAPRTRSKTSPWTLRSSSPRDPRISRSGVPGGTSTAMRSPAHRRDSGLLLDEVQPGAVAFA